MKFVTTNRITQPARIGMLFLGIFGALSTACAQKNADREAIELQLDEQVIDRLAPPPSSYAPMLAEAADAVVSVHTARVVRVYQGRGGLSPEEELLRRFFGMPLPERQAPSEENTTEQRVPQGVGSGVIVRQDGYILTNNHVVTGQRDDVADEVLVRLNDGRELPATVLGRDPLTDIAVLKIDANQLPVLPLADSESVEVGDIAFAIGNPMGVGQTITQGIVSAKGRSIGIYGRDGYENFIQTDASINPGNSGGALVDIKGRLVGINSAILSQSGGNIGIGFAIPTNLAAAITAQLTAYGEVRRGFLGVQISDITPDLAEAFDLDSTEGALVDKVEEGTPAEKGGLKVGDIITAVDGRKIRNANQLRIRIGHIRAGNEVEIEYIRNGKTHTAKVTVGDQEKAAAFGGNTILEGVRATPLNDDARSRYGIPDEIDGLLITEVDTRSPYVRQLREGMVLIEINGLSVDSVSDAKDVLQPGVNRLYIYDRGRVGFIALRVR